MSLEEVRAQNIRLVTEKALDCFINNGIANTTVSDIAKASGLTERSVYRYFTTKSDIVIAAAFCYWDRAKEYIAWALDNNDYNQLSGIEQISIILNSYSNILFADPDGIRFSLDAEVALFNAGKNEKVVNRPPERFKEYTGPLSLAIVLLHGTNHLLICKLRFFCHLSQGFPLQQVSSLRQIISIHLVNVLPAYSYK